MNGKIYDFDLKVGGGYTMSLFYLDSKTAGKSSRNEDRFSAKFVELKPYEKIVQTINFQSDKKEFIDEIIMEVFLEENESKMGEIFFAPKLNSRTKSNLVKNSIVHQSAYCQYAVTKFCFFSNKVSHLYLFH